MKLIDVLFCDDIRIEINNKLSLIGLYSDRIIFYVNNKAEIQWPLPTKLSILLRFKIEQKEKKPSRFELEYFLNNQSINNKIQGEINNVELHINLALTANIPLEPGHLGFSIKLFEKDNLLFSEENMDAIKILKT